MIKALGIGAGYGAKSWRTGSSTGITANNDGRQAFLKPACAVCRKSFAMAMLHGTYTVNIISHDFSKVVVQ